MVWEWAYTCTRYCRWSGNGPIPVRGIVGGLGMGLYRLSEYEALQTSQPQNAFFSSVAMH